MEHIEFCDFKKSRPLIGPDETSSSTTNNTPLDIARGYVAQGWSPVPVEHEGKRCHLNGWPEARLSDHDLEEHFSQGPTNIGIVLGDASRGLVDIDLDCAEAISAAEIILPPTGAIFGRKGNPKSHWLYHTEEPGQRETYIDPTDGSMLLEYRANGCMTVFPGSVHESGEAIEFDSNDAPLEIVRDALLRYVRRLAAASLAARHWKEGMRHNAALALAGCLLRSGLSENESVWFIESVCIAGNDLAERADRTRCVADTKRQLDAEHAVASWNALTRVFGPEVARRLAEWLSFQIPQEIMRPTANALVQTGGSLPFSDLWNAERFATDHRDKALYFHELGKWLIWDGARWAIDRNGSAERLAMETAKKLAMKAASNGGSEELRAAAKMQSRHSLSDTLRIAQSISRVSQRDLDVDRWQLNCRSGTIDLRTGACRVHDQRDRISKLAPVEFLPTAECPTWMRFLDRVMARNERLISFLQRAVGYSLTGTTDEQCLFVMVGGGANGKTTFLNALRELLSEYAQETPMDTLMATRGNNVPNNDLAALPGARLVWAVEAEHGRRFAETKIKYMTGGDPITARFLYGEFFTFVPQFKLWLATNELPKIEGTDDGTWRRIMVVPFDVRIPPEERDPTLAEKFKAEMPGILNWAIRGCLDWQRYRLSPPAEVIAATREYRSDMDVIAQFLEDCCDVEPEATTPVGRLYSEYVEWCDRNGDQACPKATFGRRLWARNFSQKHTPQLRLWQGLRLKGQPR